MAGIQTSRITTDSGDDLTIQPASGKKTLLKSVDSTNPGATPLVTKTDGEVTKLDISQLEDIGTLADEADWMMVHDVSDSNKIKKIKAGELLGGGSGTLPQPDFSDPLPGDSLWLDVDSVLAVQAGGSGSTATLQNSVEFAVSTQTFNQSDKNVVQGQKVFVRWAPSKLSLATHGQTISGTLYTKSGGSFTQTWNQTVVLQPTGGWSLDDRSDQPVSTEITSALGIPTGMNAPSPVTIDGGTLSSIQVSVNGGAFTSSPGKIESGQAIAVKGTTGSSNSTGYTALISIGGLQETWTVTTTAPTPAVQTPSIASPANNSTDLGPEIVALSSSYNALNGAGSHSNSDWELKKAGVVVSSSLASTTNKTSWTIPKDDLEEFTEYTIHVRYRSSDGVISVYAPESTFTTGRFGPPDPGAPIYGGYYAGTVDEAGNNVGTHWLIVAPLESGGLQGGPGGSAPTTIQWHTKGQGGAFGNEVWGYPDSYGAKSSGKYATFWWSGSSPEGPNAGAMDATNGLNTGIGGYNDWYVPATHEIAVVYFTLKPTGDRNAANSGRNPISVDPYTPMAYYAPGQTANPLFQVGGAEAYVASTYWTSNENVGGSVYAIQHDFASGAAAKTTMWYGMYHRSIRRVAIP